MLWSCWIGLSIQCLLQSTANSSHKVRLNIRVSVSHVNSESVSLDGTSPQSQISCGPAFSWCSRGLASTLPVSSQFACRNQTLFSSSQHLPLGMWRFRQGLIPALFTIQWSRCVYMQLIEKHTIAALSPLGLHVPGSAGWFLRKGL